MPTTQIPLAHAAQCGSFDMTIRWSTALCVMPASANALGPATRKAREEVKSAIWLTIGVSTLSGADEVDRFCGKSRALRRHPDQRATVGQAY